VNGINLNGATRTVTVNSTAAGAEALVSGQITNGGFIKGGAGRLALSAANTFAGGTTVNAGTLALCGGSDRLSTAGSITVNSATLDLGGKSQA
jgi:autotransporter-associated beta strand protein